MLVRLFERILRQFLVNLVIQFILRNCFIGSTTVEKHVPNYESIEDDGDRKAEMGEELEDVE